MLDRADELATFTTEPGRITRPLLTAALGDAQAKVRAWMQAAGLEPREDALGNLAGRRGEAPVLIGSHLDTVADAGRYDGILGILIGLEVAEALPDAALEVVAFADEDGLRFQSIYLGSRAFVGEPVDLAVRDRDDVTLGEALQGALGPPLHDPARAATSRSTSSRARARVRRPGARCRDRDHRPEPLQPGLHRTCGPRRHDPDAPAPGRRRRGRGVRARRRARGHGEPGLVATVGQFEIPHGAVNVIPGRADVTLDIRHQDDAVREAATEQLRALTAEIGQRREVGVAWSTISHQRATACTPALVERVAEAVAATGTPCGGCPAAPGTTR